MKIISVVALAIVAIACSLSDNDMVVGQIVEDDPCQYEDVSFVRSVHGIRTEDGEVVEEYRQEIRENETASQTTTYDDRGMPVLAYLSAGAKFYQRVINPASGEWTDWTLTGGLSSEQLQRMEEFHSESDIEVFCGVQESVDRKYLGEDTIDGIDIRRFSASLPDDHLGGADLSVDFEFWVEANGRLHQSKMVHVNKSFTDEVTVRITQHGQDVEIELPDIP